MASHRIAKGGLPVKVGNKKESPSCVLVSASSRSWEWPHQLLVDLDLMSLVLGVLGAFTELPAAGAVAAFA